jgi:hypothetical protein
MNFVQHHLVSIPVSNLVEIYQTVSEVYYVYTVRYADIPIIV